MIAKEILTQQATHPGVEIKLQTGDAASAFRNIGVHSHSAHVFGGHIEEEHALVIDLCAAFGWTGSPGTYGVFGDAISHIHGRTANAIHTPGFFNYHWVDDHVNVAPDINANCSEIDRSLRRAMCSVLGADGINEDKFTPWATQHKVLGLIFNTNTKTVSMPDTKIQKARILVAQTFHTASLSRGEYRSLMGSLRHVATWVRPARAFLQRLRQKEHLLNRYSRVTVSNDMRRDLLWWWIILNTNILNDTPMAFFNALPNTDITIETDASDSGICAVNRKDRTVLVYQFSRQELSLIQEFNCSNSNGFDINVRELLACAFAIFHWGPSWGTTTGANRSTSTSKLTTLRPFPGNRK